MKTITSFTWSYRKSYVTA